MQKDNPPNPGDNDIERWIWDEVRAKRVADLHMRCNEQLDPRDSSDSRWQDECRRVNAAFIEKVLTEEPWRSALPRYGLRIHGALVIGPLDLTFAHVSTPVELDKSRFESEVTLSFAEFQLRVSFDGSVLEKGIVANSLQVGGDLVLSSGAVRGGALDLTAANIKGYLDLGDSTFEMEIGANSLQVGSNLFLSGSVFEKGIAGNGLQVGGSFALSSGATVRGGALDLTAANIKGDLELNGSTFETGIAAGRLQVGSNLFLRDGATVRGGALSLGAANIKGNLELDGSTFEMGIVANSLQVGRNLSLSSGATVRGGALDLIAANIKGDLVLNGSTFETGIKAGRLQVGGDLFLIDGATVRGGALSLGAANINGHLHMQRSALEMGIVANGLQVGGNLFLDSEVTVRGGALDLIAANIKGNLVLNGSTFETGINASSLQVEGSLYLRKGATVQGRALILSGANIKGHLHMQRSTFEKGIEADHLQVGGSLLLTGTIFRTGPRIVNSRIEGQLNLSGATLPHLDLSGTKISGTLLIASEDEPPPKWVRYAKLVLRNVRVGALQDRTTEETWPDHLVLHLQGFVYDRPGSGWDSEESERLIRSTDWFARWLGKGRIAHWYDYCLGGDPTVAWFVRQLGKERIVDWYVRWFGKDLIAAWYVRWLEMDPDFTRQPYQHLAAMFRAAGDPERSNAILYAARDRERVEAWKKRQYLKAMVLWLMKVTIGYGLGRPFFRALAWVLVLTVVGTFVLSFSQTALDKGLPWRFGASFDQLLPVVELNKEFGEFFGNPKERDLNGWQLAYFAIHSLLGFVLGAFVVAGLAGLTQARRVDRP